MKRRKHRQVRLRKILRKIESVKMDEVNGAVGENAINRFSVAGRLDQLPGNFGPRGRDDDALMASFHEAFVKH